MLPEMPQVGADRLRLAIHQFLRELRLVEACIPKFLRCLQLQNPLTGTGERWRHNQGAYEIRTETCDRLRNKTTDIIAPDNRALDSKLFQKGIASSSKRAMTPFAWPGPE